MLEYFDNTENAVTIHVYPFPNVEASKEQGTKILEEASECREAYDVLAKMSQEQVNGNTDITDDMLQRQFYMFLDECYDVMQVVINTMLSIMGNKDEVQAACNGCMYNIINKNIARGYYGEVTDEDIQRMEEQQEIAEEPESPHPAIGESSDTDGDAPMFDYE